MSFIYLATPHNHEDPQIRDLRFKKAQLAAATVFSYQIPCYSPIAHWHPIAIDHDLPHGWSYWQQQDEALLKSCHSMWVILIEGWETSKGIKGEVLFCRAHSKPVEYIDPMDLAKYCRNYNKSKLVI